MTAGPSIEIPKELRICIEESQRVAGETPIRSLPGPLTQDLDPAVRFARGFSAHLPDGIPLEHRLLTRAVLLAEGRKLKPESAETELGAFLWLVNAWGYGNSSLGVARTLKILSEPERFTRSARQVLSLLHDDSQENPAVEAYYFLNNKAGHVPNWGPAFFTKFLAFADPANQPDTKLQRTPTLILDRWIAAAMNHFLPQGYASVRPKKAEPLGRFGQTGWNTPQYGYYLRLVERLAHEEPFSEAPYLGSLMSVERVLFHQFRDGAGRGAAGQ